MTLLSSLFINRLPQELRLIINREVGEAEWHCDQLIGTVKCEISARDVESSSSSGPHVSTTVALLRSNSQVRCFIVYSQGHNSS